VAVAVAVGLVTGVAVAVGLVTGVAVAVAVAVGLVTGVAVAVAVAVGLAVAVAVGDGVGLADPEGPQGVNAPTATVYWVPPRAVSALLLPLAPDPAVVNVLARNPTRIEPGAIWVWPTGRAALSLLKATLIVTVFAVASKNPQSAAPLSV
jgi:hypothetical protein